MGRARDIHPLTAGIDLAADPAKTAAAVLVWAPERIRVTELVLPCTDADVVRLVRRAHLDTDSAVGVDCALGWPEPFVSFVAAAQDGLAHPPPGEAAAWRRSLAYRATDEFARRVTGRPPLSVSTDRLGLVAMRLASILAQVRVEGVEVHKDARPPLFEVYPGAALRLWGFATRRYRVSEEVRAGIVAELERRLPTLELGEHRIRCIEVDHALDAVVAALVARAALRGRFHDVPDALRASARREGWMVLPEGPLEALGAAAVSGDHVGSADGGEAGEHD
ncbi:MAG: DUF429 domain-containing protein [Micrococcales bacterium]|nr:DUF429 domain-containing protein [Micrococcales bacterium]